jgi:hypothetical protein
MPIIKTIIFALYPTKVHIKLVEFSDARVACSEIKITK